MLILLKIIIPAMMILFSTSGCGWWNTAYRDFNVDDGSGAMVDIKQRAVVVSTIRDKTEVNDSGKVTTTIKSQTRVCAEPSPDALSAYAAEVAANVNVPGKASAELAAAMQESSSFVGLRTQSIQLLRDSFYRLCEGYMSGALDGQEYDTLMRRNQKYMVALLGIEQLTGTIRAPTVTINTQGSAEAGPSISRLRDELKAIDKKILDKDTTLTAKTAEADGMDDGEPKDALKKEIEKISGEIKALEEDKKTVTKQMENTKGLIARGSATGVVHTVAVPTQRSDQHIKDVAEAIKQIVLTTVTTDDMGQKCLQHLIKDSPKEPLLTICNDFFAKRDAEAEVYIKSAEVRYTAKEQIVAELATDNPNPNRLNLLLEISKCPPEGCGGAKWGSGAYAPFIGPLPE